MLQKEHPGCRYMQNLASEKDETFFDICPKNHRKRLPSPRRARRSGSFAKPNHPLASPHHAGQALIDNRLFRPGRPLRRALARPILADERAGPIVNKCPPRRRPPI